MRPLSLTLKGFCGIRDGLNRDVLALDFEQLAGDAELVAIAGQNGRGKTTIMDNLTPYAVMPSRAGADGLGSFSFYDHVFLPESIKDLTWEHEGERYRSQLIFRVNGSKKKTEAYLHVQHGDGWQPVRLPDGTVSDGKVDTYERCVEGILGSAETFFTSAFSAQGRRQLSAYKNAEVKTLLADLLGLEEIRALGARALETVRLLKTGLNAIRQERGGLEAEREQIDATLVSLGDTQAQIAAASQLRSARQAGVDQAVTRLATLRSELEASAQTEARRQEWFRERTSIIEGGRAALAQFTVQEGREAERLAQLIRRVERRTAEAQTRRVKLETQRAQLVGTLAIRSEVEQAAQALAGAESAVQQAEARIEERRRDVERLRQLRADEKALRERIGGIEREAGTAALKAKDLARRFGLTMEVPCAGTELQGRCKLLGDAREAQALVPSADLAVEKLAVEQAAARQHLADMAQSLTRLAQAEEAFKAAERDLQKARTHASERGKLAARRGEMEQAAVALERVLAELAALPEGIGEATADDIAERQSIEAARVEIAAEREKVKAQHRTKLVRVDASIAALPPAFDHGRIQAAEQALAAAKEALQGADQAHIAAIRAHQSADEAQARRIAVVERMAATDARLKHVEGKLGEWTLFAKCMSNDGVIALSIDDAGPTLTALANDLLLACYGPRFTVSLKTQVETAKGELREGFDILVHDAESGDSKSVTLMSGGERVWLNESLTRAIALYLAQNSGRQYETLFSDETDGPLDPDRKRMFMAMKREVLRLGGYRQEFFVSQTPELTVMADAVIDLDALRASTIDANGTNPAASGHDAVEKRRAHAETV